MKKVFFLVLTLMVLSAASVNAQVTIGANEDPHSGAVLDLKSTTQGLKLPTVSIGSLTTFGLPVTAPSTAANAKGMFVYNTNTTTGEGIYFWDGSRWILVKENVGVKPVTGITISAAGARDSLVWGNTLQLTATITPTDASNKIVTWGIAQGVDYASVNTNGLVTGLSAGRAIISAIASNGSTAYYNLAIVNDGIVTPVTIGGFTYRTYNYSGDVWMIDNLKGDTTQLGVNVKTQYNRGGIIDTLNAMQPIGARGYYFNIAGAAQACPSGWHLPSRNEAEKLVEYLRNLVEFRGERENWQHPDYRAGEYQPYGWMGWGKSVRVRYVGGYMSLGEALAEIQTGQQNYFMSVRCVQDK
jgi:hypothetical protein